MSGHGVPKVPGFLVRPIVPADAQAWAEIVCTPRAMEFTSSTARNAHELLPLLERIAAGGADAPLRFVLQLPGEADIAATVGFHTVSTLNGTAEISYDVAPALWGRGIATAACHAATAWGLAGRGWQRIQATTLLAHLASQRVLERCAYRREGLMRNFRRVRGLPADYFMYSILPGDASGAGLAATEDPPPP